MWPGSPQTALLFVGLPLLTALILLASPLHDAPPPLPREEAAAPVSVSTAVPRLAPEPEAAGMPRAVSRPTVDDDGAVPAVIYEVRRTGRHRPRESAGAQASGSAPAVMSTTRARLHPATGPESLTRTTVLASDEARISAALLGTQSP